MAIFNSYVSLPEGKPWQVSSPFSKDCSPIQDAMPPELRMFSLLKAQLELRIGSVGASLGAFNIQGIVLMEVSINRGTPIAEWFIMENPTKMEDLGVPLFQETSYIIDNEQEQFILYACKIPFIHVDEIRKFV